MMSYRDRSYCGWGMGENSPCRNMTCSRRFTNKDRQEAIEWWKSFGSPGGEGNFPLMFADLQTPECGARMV